MIGIVHEELQSWNNWFIWKKGDPKPNNRYKKIALNLDGTLWDGKQTWSYTEAVAAYIKLFPPSTSDLYDGGIAFSLNNTPYVVFDLDTNRENMLLHALLLHEFQTTYIEESISLTGYHIVVKDSTMTRLYVEQSLGLSILANSEDKSNKSCWVIFRGYSIPQGDWLDIGPKPIQEINLMQNPLVKKIVEQIEAYRLAEEEYDDMVHGHQTDDDDEEYW